MSCKTYLYKNQELTEAQLIRALSLDPKLVESYKAQEEREGSDYEAEDRATFQKKVEALQRTMNVEVIYDDSIESSRLLGKNDPRTKAAGKPVILINPNQLFKTTAIHEFGHVFIDAFPGGLANKRLQKALDQLRGTELWAEVEELYPDLSESMLHKEILVTAIGREGSIQWADADGASKWESFMSWISDYLKRVLGLERSEIVSLSKELLNDQVKQIDTTQLEEIAQELRAKRITKEEKPKTKAEKEFEVVQGKIEKTYANLLGVITKIYKNQKQSKTSKAELSREAKNLKDNGITRLSSITDLQKKLTQYENADKKIGFVRYLNWAKKELYFMDAELDRRNSAGKIDVDTLRKAYDWSASFTIVKEIQNSLEELKNDAGMTNAQIKVMSDMILVLQGIKERIDSKLIKHSRDRYEEMLAANDSETDERIKLGYKEDWKNLEDNGGSGMQEGEFVISKMQENHEAIQEEKMKIAGKRALESLTSMSTLSMVLLTEKEMRSKDISLISFMLDAVSGRIERFATEEATNEDAFEKAFKKNANIQDSDSRNMKKKYAGMFVTSKSGQSYYTGEYNPEFIEKKNEMARQSGDADIYDEKYKAVEISALERENENTAFYYNSEMPHPTTGKKGRRKFSIYGAKDIRVDGMDNLKKGERPMHLSYKNKAGKRVTISINEAIARSEYSHWMSANTTEKTWTNKKGDTVKGMKPIDSWKSEEYKELEAKHPEKFAELERLKENNRVTDERYNKKDSIVEKYKSVEFMRLPGVMKSNASRLVEGQSMITMGKASLSKLIETQQDEFDVETHTDYQEGETLRVPSPYRAKLNEADQSFDLHTMGLLHTVMGKNYEEKRAVEASLIVITEVMAKKKFPVIDKLSGQQKIDAQSKIPLWESGDKSQEYAKALSIIENRLYSMTTKQAGGFKVMGKQVETQQIAKAGLKYFGTVSLVFNYANSIVNTGTGTISNIIEAIGGDVYNLKDYKRAQQLYNFDLKNIMEDMGSNVQKSRTNLLLNNFNTMGPNHLNTEFEEGTGVEGMIKMSTLRPLATAGEHMMQSKVMYAILSSIKVQDKTGKWLDADGKVTSSKKTAASLADMITFKENSKGGQEMVLHESVQNTSFTTHGGQERILLETRNLIRSKVDELHGQYTNDIQAHAQRYMLGKMGFFLRKWMIPGYLRRLRGITNLLKPADAEMQEADEFYSADQKENMEGYYISAMRFMAKIVNDTREDSFNIIKSWKELTTKQKAGVRKTMADVGFMALTIIAYNLLAGDGDLDDDEVFWAYLIRRQQSELTFFANPVEAFKIAQTPTAAVGNLKQILKTMQQLASPTELYKSGPYADELKLKHTAKKLMFRFKNTEDFRQSLQFLNSSSGK